MGEKTGFYIMEHEEETDRLEKKTDPSDVRRQAQWCGVKPGQRLLDVCCGPGKTTSILHDLVQPEGSVVGLDSSPKRIAHARKHYGGRPGIEFVTHDMLTPLNGLGTFDAIWVRFVLEYYREQNKEIVRNLADRLTPGGSLFLIDLDYNCLSHYDLPRPMAAIIPEIMNRLEAIYNFDAFAGRKLYSHLYDLGFEGIEVQITAHHVIYGAVRDIDSYNWMKKIEVVAPRLADLFRSYPGGYEAFLTDFRTYFHDPRRFTYTPLIMCKGKKPANGLPAQPDATSSK